MQTRIKIEKRAALSIPMRLNFCQRLNFFLLSVRLISFHRFITLEQELEGRLRSNPSVSRTQLFGWFCRRIADAR
jgi:hypothetical protein